jgi:hypothetical protein
MTPDGHTPRLWLPVSSYCHPIRSLAISVGTACATFHGIAVQMSNVRLGSIPVDGGVDLIAIALAERRGTRKKS